MASTQKLLSYNVMHQQMMQKKTGKISSTNNCKKAIDETPTHDLLLVIGDLNA